VNWYEQYCLPHLLNIRDLRARYYPGPRFASYFYNGIAGIT